MILPLPALPYFILPRLCISTPVKRSFSGAASGTYREKTFKEAWLSDTGAYPVMGVIAFAVVFSLGYGASVMLTHPDARLSKGKRKALFRGEMANEH